MIVNAKNYGYSYFYNDKSDSVFRFSVKSPNIRKKRSQNEPFRQFSDKINEKVEREKTYLLKLEFYNTDRKMKSTIRCIFISIVMHPNFMHFREKINFKSALEFFTPVSGHSRTVLRVSMRQI